MAGLLGIREWVDKATSVAVPHDTSRPEGVASLALPARRQPAAAPPSLSQAPPGLRGLGAGPELSLVATAPGRLEGLDRRPPFVQLPPPAAAASQMTPTGVGIGRPQSVGETLQVWLSGMFDGQPGCEAEAKEREKGPPAAAVACA
mmetsp:Transcript_17206/g.55604  ORF Transcript_17206/g.55604 Transcript_17206/m.55604 type:complete len:146 (-) Transcript_17206:67-504(-)